jgi:hypothetical protein
MQVMGENRTDPLNPNEVKETPANVGVAATVPEIPTTDALRHIACSVMADFQVNSDHRQVSGVDEMLVNSARAARMKYSPHQEAVLKAANLDTRAYPPLTPMYMRALQSMLVNIISQSGDKPYSLSPTPRAEVPKSVTKRIYEQIAQEILQFFADQGGQLTPEEEQLFYIAIISRTSELYDEIVHKENEWAKERCDRMDVKIHDQMIEGDFMAEFAKFVRFFCTYGTGILTFAPRVIPTAKCKESGSLDAIKYTMEYKRIPVFEAINPWDCYPAPNAKSIDDGPLCIRVRYTANTLWQYADASDEAETQDGWQRNTVRALLARYPRGGVKIVQQTFDLERRSLERDSIVSNANDCTLEGVRRIASVRGSELISAGIDKTPSGENIIQNRYYKTDITVIGDYVVCCRVVDDRMPFPVVKAVLYQVPDSWWGESIADILCSCQGMQNNALKNLTLNIAFSSNPVFVCSNVDRAVSLDGKPALLIRAGRMIGFRKDASGNVGSPIDMLQAKDNTAVCISLMKEAVSMANDYCGIPLHALGSSANLNAGAARTASGMNMLQESALRTVNMSLIVLGMDAIVPCVKMLNVYNLLYDKDMSIKGDVNVAPSGLMGKILREAESQKRLQLFNALGGPQMVAPALTVESFFELLRPELEAVGGINPDKVIPSKERMGIIQELLDVTRAAQAAQQQMAPVQGQGQPQMGGEQQLPGIEQEPKPPAPGTVAERRGAA